MRVRHDNLRYTLKIDIFCCSHSLGMSVYEQIASRTRSKRHRKPVKDIQLEEQVEEIKDNDDDDDDGRSSVVLPVR